MDVLNLYPPLNPPSKFKIVGFIPSARFQKSRYLIEKLHSCFPKEYSKPEVRAMLNFEWDEFLTQMKREFGKAYYLLNGPVAVYLNDQLLGDDQALNRFINEKYRFISTMDFEELAEKELMKYFQEISEKQKRKFAYITVAIDERVIGSMLFLLYHDLVPKTCDNFLERCVNHLKQYTYKGTKIHRVAKYGWVQCGGFDLKHRHMACENYTVPHDRRGVLSMCNNGRHKMNSTQFHITLNPAPWMDYNYVAFGQLIQGAEILNLIEKITDFYQNPTRKIEIVNCGEFSLCQIPDEGYTKALNPPYETLFTEGSKVDDVDSILSETGYKTGKYCLRTDLRPYLPFSRFSKMFDSYVKDLEEPVEEQGGAELAKSHEEPEIEPGGDFIRLDLIRRDSIFRKSPQFYKDKHIIF